jgi:hypothetical protein
MYCGWPLGCDLGHTARWLPRHGRLADGVRTGGALISDDTNFSRAFTGFAAAVGQSPALVRESAKAGVIGLLRRALARRQDWPQRCIKRAYSPESGITSPAPRRRAVWLPVPAQFGAYAPVRDADTVP